VARKAANQRRREHQLKRGGGRVVAGAGLAVGGPSDEVLLAQVAGGELTPELAAAVTDEIRRLFGSLSDESLRLVALMRMEGFANEEIAAALDVSLRSVERKLELVRKAWNRESE
jgi:DNA-directed RNA polymerase specialized sigma24 family protein